MTRIQKKILQQLNDIQSPTVGGVIELPEKNIEENAVTHSRVQERISTEASEVVPPVPAEGSLAIEKTGEK